MKYLILKFNIIFNQLFLDCSKRLLQNKPFTIASKKPQEREKLKKASIYFSESCAHLNFPAILIFSSSGLQLQLGHQIRTSLREIIGEIHSQPEPRSQNHATNHKNSISITNGF